MSSVLPMVFGGNSLIFLGSFLFLLFALLSVGRNVDSCMYTHNLPDSLFVDNIITIKKGAHSTADH